MKKNENKFKANLSSPHGKPKKYLVFMNSEKNGEPPLRALRYKVLALVLLAGNLELQRAKSAVEKVLETALEQRDFFFNKEAFSETDAWIMLKHGSLYNRQILGIGVLYTVADSDKCRKIVNETRIKLDSKIMPHYNALTTPYDITFLRGQSDIDYSKGRLPVSYFAPLQDSEFNNFILTVRKYEIKNEFNREM